MSKKLKAVESNIQPNHKEAELWVTPTNNDGSKEVKYWNSKTLKWSKCEGEGNGGDVEAAAEYYRIDWDKAKEKKWVTDDGLVKRDVLGNIFAFFHEVKVDMQEMIQYSTMTTLSVAGYVNSMAESMYANIKMFSFEPCYLTAYQDGNLVLEKKYNTMLDAYPALNEQGVFIPITKEEFYSLT